VVRTVSAAEAKAHFSALMAEVAHAGKHVVIERRGKPLAALVSMADLKRLGRTEETGARPQGALALAGAWREVEEQRLDALIRGIYARQVLGTGRRTEVEP
jgi:prevent-host-death family protein